MAMTFRQLVNNVLKTTGGTQISGTAGSTVVSDTYQLMVCEFANQIIDEVAASAQWRYGWFQYNIAYPANVGTAQIKDSISGATATSRASLVRMRNQDMCREIGLVFDTTSSGTPFPLLEAPLPDMLYIQQLSVMTPTSYSTSYAIADNGNDTVSLLTWPISSVARNIAVTMFEPGIRFDPTTAGITGNTLDAPLLVPYQPCLIGTTWQVLEERGEELGQGGAYTEAKYRRALDDAIGRESASGSNPQLIVA